MAKKGKVYLVPTILGESSLDMVIPQGVQTIVKDIRFFIVENIKTTRRYLRNIDKTFPIDDSVFYELNKHTNPDEISKYLQPVLEGNDVAVISEAGCPGIADPGADIVNIAYQKNIQVVPLVGPSSMFMALMASGLNGQNFAFHGYLSKDKFERIKQIKRLESNAKHGAQIFMDTPFRNMQLLEDVLTHCHVDMKLCIACDITTPGEIIKTKTIGEWQKQVPNLNKRPCVFVLGI
jgi:16S rRNA (cytidine1402-2'-O)-methyltransferase